MISTVWGYDVDAEEVPLLIDPDAFSVLSKGRFSPDDPRVKPALAAVSAAVRSYCGWHVSPALDCVAPILADPQQRVYALPTMHIESIFRVVEGGADLDPADYSFLTYGLIRRGGWKCWPDAWNPATVYFRSGFDPGAAADLQIVVYQVAANAIVAAPGVRSESVGDVSTDYNQTASGVSGGVALLDRDKDLLAPYRIREMR